MRKQALEAAAASLAREFEAAAEEAKEAHAREMAAALRSSMEAHAREQVSQGHVATVSTGH